jgi:hypothetical protein
LSWVLHSLNQYIKRIRRVTPVNFKINVIKNVEFISDEK